MSSTPLVAAPPYTHEGGTSIDIIDAHGDCIATLTSGTITHEDMATARLFAAAPDLLAACEAYIAAEDGTDLMTAFVGMTRARALMDRAIAKAKDGAA